jgi:hypothetical protein
MSRTVSDGPVGVLKQIGVTQIFKLIGGCLIPLAEATRRSQIGWTGIHHEEGAALAAAGQAKLTGQLAECAGTTSPGGTNSVDSLYEVGCDPGGHAMHRQHNKERAMHSLTALREPPRNFAGGIRFTMMDGPMRVICWVTREALNRIEGGNPSQRDPMVCFERHHLKIEHLASQKYGAGERSPIVMTFDFEALR